MCSATRSYCVTSRPRFHQRSSNMGSHIRVVWQRPTVRRPSCEQPRHARFHDLLRRFLVLFLREQAGSEARLQVLLHNGGASSDESCTSLLHGCTSWREWPSLNRRGCSIKHWRRRRRRRREHRAPTADRRRAAQPPARRARNARSIGRPRLADVASAGCSVWPVRAPAAWAVRRATRRRAPPRRSRRRGLQRSPRCLHRVVHPRGACVGGTQLRAQRAAHGWRRSGGRRQSRGRRRRGSPRASPLSRHASRGGGGHIADRREAQLPGSQRFPV